MNISVLDRFLKYVSVGSQSDADSATVPSTPGQTELARLLAGELKDMGAQAELDDDSGIVYASIPSNVEGNVPVIGWVAHVDTAPGVSGSGVKPRIVRSYDGGDILLNPEQGMVLSPAVFPELTDYLGQDLVVTDGTTLLGADDKAGVAEIMDMAASFLLNPERPHGEIRIAFTPDEEIGRGTDAFDVARFGADFAYTVDGGALGEIEYENFNAASAVVTVRGSHSSRKRQGQDVECLPGSHGIPGNAARVPESRFYGRVRGLLSFGFTPGRCGTGGCGIPHQGS